MPNLTAMGLFDNTNDIALIFGFGKASQMSNGQRPHGLLAALHQELLDRHLWATLIAGMDPGYVRNLLLVINLDRASASKQHRKNTV